MLTEIEVRLKLRDAVDKSKSQTDFASQHGLSDSMICQAISGTAPVSDRVARTIGYRKAIVYFPA